MYLGSWKIDDLLTFYANTTRFDTGSATDADSVPSYHIYEDETPTPLITGTMALLNGANTIGLYSEQITLSAANGFEKGRQYLIYKQATVNSVIGANHDTFQIEAEVDANTVSDKGGYSLSSPQNFNLNGNISGTITNVQNVLNPVGLVTGTYISNLANLDVSVSTRASQSSLDTLDDVVDTEVGAIKTKTDQLTFTKANELDANVQSLNGTEIIGDGNGTPWGPV